MSREERLFAHVRVSAYNFGGVIDRFWGRLEKPPEVKTLEESFWNYCCGEQLKRVLDGIV